MTIREERILKEGEGYQIYVNPNKLKNIRFLRCIVTPFEILPILMGIAFVGGGILCMVKGIIEFF